MIAIRQAIAAAALAALVVPAGFAQDTKPGQQNPTAQCEKLSGMARQNCLDKLRVEGKIPGSTSPGAAGTPSVPERPVPPPGAPR